MKSIPLALAVLGVLAFRVSAQTAPFNVHIEVQMVSMPLDKGLPLLPNLRDAGSIESAFSQIQTMIAAGDATLIAWPELLTKSGQRAVAEDITEVRYASEFAQPKRPEPTPGGDKKTAPEYAHPERAGAPVPTAFETRNAGATLEVEPVVSPDGKTIDLNLVPQHVRLLEFASVASGRDANGHDWKIEQPRFFTAKTTTSLTVLSGQRVLLAEFRGPEGSDQIEFFILKADVTPVDGAKKK